MDFANYKPILYQYQNFLDDQGDFVILNFSGHKIEKNYYPDKYNILEISFQIENINSENLDIVITKIILEKLKDFGLNNLEFKPILILPKYEPIKIPILFIIIELFNGKFPIIGQLVSEDGFKTRIPKYFVSNGVKKRIKGLRNIQSKNVIEI